MSSGCVIFLCRCDPIGERKCPVRHRERRVCVCGVCVREYYFFFGAGGLPPSRLYPSWLIHPREGMDL